ncbi:MAG: hypothetical protein IRZ16_00835 [Myxococcaceae bacterium]|nr:hypothetical protein [Myxococcaceae bacterium]
MTGHRNARFSLSVGCFSALLAIAIACSGGDIRPCNDCPQVAGQWRLHYETGTSPSKACEQLGRTTPPDTLDLEQVGSALSSTFEDVPLRGTLYDTYDFSLNGTQQVPDAGSVSISINGRFVPALEVTDAGERLQGTFVGTYGTGEACVISRGYTAERL